MYAWSNNGVSGNWAVMGAWSANGVLGDGTDPTQVDARSSRQSNAVVARRGEQQHVYESISSRNLSW